MESPRAVEYASGQEDSRCPGQVENRCRTESNGFDSGGSEAEIRQAFEGRQTRVFDLSGLAASIEYQTCPA